MSTSEKEAAKLALNEDFNAALAGSNKDEVYNTIKGIADGSLTPSESTLGYLAKAMHPESAENAGKTQKNLLTVFGDRTEAQRKATFGKIVTTAKTQTSAAPVAKPVVPGEDVKVTEAPKAVAPENPTLKDVYDAGGDAEKAKRAREEADKAHTDAWFPSATQDALDKAKKNEVEKNEILKKTVQRFDKAATPEESQTLKLMGAGDKLNEASANLRKAQGELDAVQKKHDRAFISSMVEADLKATEAKKKAAEAALNDSTKSYTDLAAKADPATAKFVDLRVKMNDADNLHNESVEAAKVAVVQNPGNLLNLPDKVLSGNGSSLLPWYAVADGLKGIDSAYAVDSAKKNLEKATQEYDAAAANAPVKQEEVRKATAVTGNDQAAGNGQSQGSAGNGQGSGGQGQGNGGQSAGGDERSTGGGRGHKGDHAAKKGHSNNRFDQGSGLFGVGASNGKVEPGELLVAMKKEGYSYEDRMNAKRMLKSEGWQSMSYGAAEAKYKQITSLGSFHAQEQGRGQGQEFHGEIHIAIRGLRDSGVHHRDDHHDHGEKCAPSAGENQRNEKQKHIKH